MEYVSRMRDFLDDVRYELSIGVDLEQGSTESLESRSKSYARAYYLTVPILYTLSFISIPACIGGLGIFACGCYLNERGKECDQILETRESI